MKLRPLSFIFLCLALLPGGIASAKPQGGSPAIIKTVNKTSYSAWITVYDAGKTRHIDYGTLDAYGSRVWTGCCYIPQFPYHVRAEVKKNVDGRERTIFDTSIQVTPRGCVPEDGIAVELRKGSGESFYWEDVGCPH